MKGTTLTLVGITQKGKNRIREHGNKWLIISVDESVSCLDDKPGWFIRPVDNSMGARWIRQSDDKDFKVV